MTQKNILFLWDNKYMQRSAGIFVEQAKNLTIRGHEFISKHNADQNKNINRIQKHDLQGKEVHIISGEFKGQKGLVTHVNGQLAEIETSIRAKKVFIDVSALVPVVDGPKASYQNPADVQDGGATMYGGGQTAYDVGKTPMPMNTPAYDDYRNPE